MKWVILAVGRLKKKYVAEGVAEYMQRARRMRPIEMVEVPAAKATPSAKDGAARSRAAESRALLSRLRDDDYVILLDEHGAARGTEQFAAHLAELDPSVRARLVFVVGGAFGVDESMKARADETLSFGPITLPHELARLVLAEQLYRALTIQHGHPYHHG